MRASSLGLGDGFLDAAQLVDQSDAVRLGAGPDAAAGDLAHPGGRQATTGCETRAMNSS
jgi:hypothetical protein